MAAWLESDIILHHNTDYHSNPARLYTYTALGPLATTASLQQVPEPRRSRLPQLLHEHLGFVS